MWHFFFLFLSGLVGGFLGGLLGIGGGIIYIIVLPVVLTSLGVPREELVQYTIANSVFASFFSSMSAILVKNSRFYAREVLTIGAAGVVTSVVLLKFVVNTPWYSKGLFNIVIVLLLLYMLLKMLLNSGKPLPAISDADEKGVGLRLSLAGLAQGAVSALSGLGGGIVVVPILNSWFHMDIKKANAISLGAIGVTSLVMTIACMLEATQDTFHYYNVGYIIFPVSLSLAAGVVLASPWGVKASRALPSQILAYVFALFMALVIIRKVVELATQPG